MRQAKVGTKRRSRDNLSKYRQGGSNPFHSQSEVESVAKRHYLVLQVFEPFFFYYGANRHF
jgi:hypothetical protein